MTSLKEMTMEEILQKVDSGEITSNEYHSFAEYVKAMET